MKTVESFRKHNAIMALVGFAMIVLFSFFANSINSTFSKLAFAPNQASYAPHEAPTTSEVGKYHTLDPTGSDASVSWSEFTKLTKDVILIFAVAWTACCVIHPVYRISRLRITNLRKRSMVREALLRQTISMFCIFILTVDMLKLF